MVWPALAMMMVASVGSIAQLSDSATFGLGAVTVYLIPALLFLLPGGSGLRGARHQPRGRHLRLGPRGVRGPNRVPGHLARLHEQRDAVPVAAVVRCCRAGDRVRSRRTSPATGCTWAPSSWSGFWAATFVVSQGMKTTAGLSNIGVGLGTVVPALALILFMFAWLVDDNASAAPLRLERHHAAVRRALEHRAGGGHVRRVRRPRGQRRAHQAPQGPPEVVLQGRDDGGRDGLRDVHARFDRDLGGRPRLVAGADLRRLAGVHGLCRRLRHPGPVQCLVRPLGPRRRGCLDRLDRRAEPEHVAGRPGRLPAASDSRGRTRTTCRCRSCSSRA